MTDELTTTGAATVVQLPYHEPNPKLATIPNPDGDGSIALVKSESGGWEIQELAGPRENVARHRFATLRSLVRWVSRWSENPASVHILAELPNRIAEIVENYRGAVVARIDPRDRFGDRVTCSVPLDPTFANWAALCGGGRIDQRTFFAFLRSFGHAMASPDRLTELLGALATVRVSGNASLNAELAPNGMIRVTGNDAEVALTTDIPGEIELLTPIYDGVHFGAPEHPVEDEATYLIRVVLDVQASPATGLTIAAAMPELESTLIRANDDLAAHVERELGDGFLVGVGEEKGEAVETLGEPRVYDPSDFFAGHPPAED